MVYLQNWRLRLMTASVTPPTTSRRRKRFRASILSCGWLASPSVSHPDRWPPVPADRTQRFHENQKTLVMSSSLLWFVGHVPGVSWEVVVLTLCGWNGFFFVLFFLGVFLSHDIFEHLWTFTFTNQVKEKVCYNERKREAQAAMFPKTIKTIKTWQITAITANKCHVAL